MDHDLAADAELGELRSLLARPFKDHEWFEALLDLMASMIGRAGRHALANSPYLREEISRRWQT